MLSFARYPWSSKGSSTSRAVEYASLAAHLVERVLPRVRLRQWVLTLPQPLPRLLAWRPELLSRVLAALSRTLQADLQQRSGAADGQSGLVAFVQTFTSDLRLFVHVHALVPDGVYVATAKGAQFVSAPPPTRASLQATADALAGSVQRVCQRWRRGLDPEAAPVDAAQLNRLAQQVEPAVPRASPRSGRARRRWVARCAGLELHAGVSVAAHDDRGRERLVRYVARAAVSLQRLSLEADGTVRVQLKGASRSGRTHVRLRPEVFVLRLASLLLPPGVNRVRYFGVFAPAAALRRHVVPPLPPAPVSRPGGRWIRWQVLLRHVFGVDPQRCPQCGAPLRTVATLQGRGRAFVVLRWLGWTARGPPRPR